MKRLGLTLALMLAGILLISSVVRAATGFDFSLPIPTPPRIFNVSDNSLSVGTGDVTVTAVIEVYAPLIYNSATTVYSWGTQANLSWAKLHYSLDYATANPPTWTEVSMTVTNTNDQSSAHHKIVYTVQGTILGQAAAVKVYYVISCQDNFHNSDAGMGNNIATESRTPLAGPGWGENTPPRPTDWKNENAVWAGETTLADETLSYGDATHPPVSLPNYMDFVEMRVANLGSNFQSNTNYVYVKLKLQEGAVFDKGPSLDNANGYVVAFMNLGRPDDKVTADIVEGTYGAINFGYAGSTGGILPGNPSVNSFEDVGDESTYGFVGGTVYSTAGFGNNYLTFKCPLKSLSYHPNKNSGTTAVPDDSEYNLYDPGCLTVIGGGGKVNLSDLTNVSFVLMDLTNGCNFYLRNHNYTVSGTGPVNVTVSGNVTDGGPLPASNLGGTTEVYSGNVTNWDSPGTAVATPSLTNGSYSFEVIAGTYSIRVVVAGYLSATVSGLSLTGNLTQHFVVYKPENGGDLSGDDKVNMTDFSLFVPNFKKENPTVADGDFNADGKIDLKDFGILAKNYH